MSAASTGWSIVAVVALAGIAAASYGQAHKVVGAGGAAPSRGMQTAANAPKDAPINACAFLKDAEIKEIVGLEMTAGERHDDGEVGGSEKIPTGTYSSTCLWRAKLDVDKEPDPALPMGGTRFVILQAMAWPKAENAADFLAGFHDAFKEHIIPSAPVPVEGIGEQALWWGDGVAARKGPTSIGVSVFLQNGDKPTQRLMEEMLAKKIVARVK
jgi:hypothetical protein